MDSGPRVLPGEPPLSVSGGSNMDNRLATELDRSRRVRLVLSGDSSREPDLEGGVRRFWRLNELARSATDGEREGSRLLLTEKKADEGRSRLVATGLASPE
jgi:hypothetical protein